MGEVKADELRGHLGSLILSIIESGPMHGYAVAEALAERSDRVIDLPTGTLYPALRRLERDGYLQSGWDSVNGRKRRTYELTTSGKAALEANRREFVEFSTTIANVLAPRTQQS